MNNVVVMPQAKLSEQGWAVTCQQGPLAEAIAHLSGQPAVNKNGEALIPYTPQLDEYIIALVDALIGLRYDTNRVQLTLADAVVVQND